MCRTAGIRRRRRQFLAEYKKCRRDLEEDVKYKEEISCIEQRAQNKDIQMQPEKQNGKIENQPRRMYMT
jgi:phosphoribosylaminoimidazole carboxylase (NCAIR synthetase)